MKYHIFTILSAFMLFSSCAEEELDHFAIEDVSISISQTWDGQYPQFDVSIANERNHKLDKVMLRVSYHDQVDQTGNDWEFKDIELTCVDGKYTYTSKDFPYAFTGDCYKAYAYTKVDGCTMSSEVLTMRIPGSYEPQVSSATFSFDEASDERPFYGCYGTIHLAGSNFSRYLYISRYEQTDDWLSLPEPESYNVSANDIFVNQCIIRSYGEHLINVNQYGKRYSVSFDVTGLSIDGVDKTKARFRETITMKVSGMKPDCIYEIYDAKVISAEDGVIKFTPNQYWQNQQIRLEEKRPAGNWNVNTMYCYSKERITVY